MLLSTCYDLFAFVLLGLFRQLFAGVNEWAILAESFAQSLLFFLVLVTFAILLFNLFKGNALAITGYVVYLFFVEQIAMLAVGFATRSDLLGNIFWVSNYQKSLQTVTPEMFAFGLFTLLVFLAASYLLFSKHELK